MISDMDSLEKEIIEFVKPIRPAWKQRKIDSNAEYVLVLDAKFPGVPRIQQIYMLENDLAERPVCKVCGGEVFFRFDKGYSETCSKKCMGELSHISGRSKEWYEKSKETMLERYGVENAFQSEEIKEKIKETLMDKYGGDHPTRIPEFVDKQRKTNIERYGKPEGRINHDEVKQRLSDKSWSKIEMLALNKITIISKDSQSTDYLSVYSYAHPDITFICNECGETDIVNYMTVYNRIREFGTPCKHFSRVTDRGSSGGQRAVADFIRGLGFEVSENNKTIIAPKHLDMVIEESKIAIEYNGLFYHCEKRRDEKYHINKLNATNAAGYKLISIFEDEWIFKREIVESRLKHILTKKLPRISARKCRIKKISIEDARNFIEKTHIQGYAGCRYRYGLYYEDELVAAMTFSLPSIAKGAKNSIDEIELNRYCCTGNVIGGAGKLLAAFCRDHSEVNTVYSFADRRWSDGNLYKKLGFTLDHITKPNYWYTKGILRIHRFALRKNKKDIQHLSEKENRILQGYSRIWDCGSFKYLYLNPNHK